ncbi:hypothetical protein L7F22_000895 [Adiantum nelumboides]|nr:hypothetical protein [Adiantum nelumboides]
MISAPDSNENTSSLDFFSRAWKLNSLISLYGCEDISLMFLRIFSLSAEPCKLTGRPSGCLIILQHSVRIVCRQQTIRQQHQMRSPSGDQRSDFQQVTAGCIYPQKRFQQVTAGIIHPLHTTHCHACYGQLSLLLDRRMAAHHRRKEELRSSLDSMLPMYHLMVILPMLTTAA